MRILFDRTTSRRLGWRLHFQNQIIQSIAILILLPAFHFNVDAAETTATPGISVSRPAGIKNSVTPPNRLSPPKPPPPPKERPQLMIQADELAKDNEKNTVDLKGHVQIIFKDYHLMAESAFINLNEKTILANGSVTLTSPQATVYAERVEINYITTLSTVYNGFVQSLNIVFQGSKIEKIAEDTYLADDSYFTTCTNCPASWSFSGRSIKAQIGGYATLNSAFLRFGNIPVFWLPYIVVPLKSDRQSGLLTPDFASSDNGGLAITQSYFWAMSPSQDITWTLKNYELKGLQGLFNYRYVLSDKGYGEFSSSYLEDKVFASDKRLNDFRTDKDGVVPRWFIKYDHYDELPNGYIVRAQINNASDLQYPKDFTSDTRNHGDSAMESRVSISNNTEQTHTNVDLSYYKNMLQSDPLSSNNFSVHRLPEVKYSQKLSQIEDTGFAWNFDLTYNNFNRSSYSWDDMIAANSTDKRHLSAGGSDATACSKDQWEKNPACSAKYDGVFDPAKDIIRTGQRLDFTPTLYRPIKTDYFEFLPKISYRETQYYFDVGESKTNIRRYLRTEVATRTTFSRIYSLKEDDYRPLPNTSEITRVKHEIQPEVTMTTIPWLNHPAHPFFGNLSNNEVPFFSQENLADSDLDNPYGLQFDYNDRVYDRKRITFSLTNKLTQKIMAEDQSFYRQFITWKLAQSYDAYQEEKGNRPLSDILSDLRVRLDYFEIYQRANYFPYQAVTNTSTRIRFTSDRGDFFQLGHILNYDISSQNNADAKKQTEDYTITLKKTFTYVDLLGKFTLNVFPSVSAEQLKTWGYIAQFKMPGDCLYLQFTNYRVTDGDTNYKLSFLFSWDGQARGPIAESLIDVFGF